MKQDLHEGDPPLISIQQMWDASEIQVIDVRAPREFENGHIPGAVNIPLLSDSERETVGILYKRFGRSSAVNQGYTLLEPKLEALKGRFTDFSENQKIAVYCARGGMRSQVITALMLGLGYSVNKVRGGYKSFRQWNLEKLENFTFQNLVVLQGKTGVGKTLVLEQIKNSLDLEGLAQHRGSMFGAVGKNAVAQKEFEAVLLLALEKLDPSKPVYVEGESRKIGPVSVPNNIFQQMKSARTLLLTAEIDTRVGRIIDEYIDQYPAERDVIRAIIQKLVKDLGKKNVAHLTALFDAEDFHPCFQYILENYYDVKYAHSMKGLEFEAEISTENIAEAAIKIQQLG